MLWNDSLNRVDSASLALFFNSVTTERSCTISISANDNFRKNSEDLNNEVARALLKLVTSSCNKLVFCFSSLICRSDRSKLLTFVSGLNNSGSNSQSPMSWEPTKSGQIKSESESSLLEDWNAAISSSSADIFLIKAEDWDHESDNMPSTSARDLWDISQSCCNLKLRSLSEWSASACLLSCISKSSFEFNFWWSKTIDFTFGSVDVSNDVKLSNPLCSNADFSFCSRVTWAIVSWRAAVNCFKVNVIGWSVDGTWIVSKFATRL